MRLNDWMSKNDISDQALAEQVGSDRSTISRIRRGKRMPSPEMMRVISKVTGEAVMANDFVHDAPIEAAA